MLKDQQEFQPAYYTDCDLRPSNRFLSNSVFKQWLHLVSELWEITIALLFGNYVKAAEEVTDLQMSGMTMLAILGFGENGRRWLRRKVNIKNELRGYYDGQ